MRSSRDHIRQRLSPLPLLLVGAGVREGGSELVGDQLEEALVLVVEGPPRIDADDEPASSPAGGRRRNGERLDEIRLGNAEATYLVAK